MMILMYQVSNELVFHFTVLLCSYVLLSNKKGSIGILQAFLDKCPAMVSPLYQVIPSLILWSTHRKCPRFHHHLKTLLMVGDQMCIGALTLLP